MADPFIAEIIMFGGNFAPRGWALCDGQLLQIAQHSALFSILGTTYGGDGRTTFALPDMRGRSPVHAGNGPGLSNRRLGEKAGSEPSNMPGHTHAVRCYDQSGTVQSPVGGYPAGDGTGFTADWHTAQNANMAADMLSNQGGEGDNMHPFLTVNFIIALVGTFPSRN